MIIQIMTDVELYSFLQIIVIFMAILFAFMGVISLGRYFQRKAKIALFLSLNYFTYVIGLIFLEIGYRDVIDNGTRTPLYFLLVAYFLAFVMAGSIFLFLFFTEISKFKQQTKSALIISGISIIIWIFLPWNNWSVTGLSGFQFRYITYMLILIYFLIVYVGSAHVFMQMVRRVPENRSSFVAIITGNLIFSLYFIFITIYGITQNGILMIIGMILILISEILFFIGFILPTLKKK